MAANLMQPQVLQVSDAHLDAIAMPYVEPIQELTIKYLRAVKRGIKQRLLELGIGKNPGTKPHNWVIREIMGGDKGGSPADFVDMDFANPTLANEQHWEISTTDQGTVHNLADWMTANSKIDRDTWLGIYGFWDQSIEGIPPITDLYLDTPTGVTNRILFQRGGSDLAHWQLDNMYCYPNAIGIAKEPVIYEPTEVYQVRTCHHDIGVVKAIGLRGYVLEPYGAHCAPEVLGTRVAAPHGGFDPIQEVTLSEIRKIKEYCTRVLVQMAMNKSVARSVSEVYIRNILVGDKDATDDVDLYLADTQLAGHEKWAADDDEITVETHSNIIDTNSTRKKVGDDKYLAIYGWMDGGTTGSLSSVWFKSSGGVKDWWLTQPCYAYNGSNDVIGGVTKRPIFYTENEEIQILLNNQLKTDTFPVFLGLICEAKGQVLSRD